MNQHLRTTIYQGALKIRSPAKEINPDNAGGQGRHSSSFEDIADPDTSDDNVENADYTRVDDDVYFNNRNRDFPHSSVERAGSRRGREASPQRDHRSQS